MEYQGSIKKYFDMILGVAQRMMEPIFEKGRKELGNSLMDSILGANVAPSVKQKISPKDYFIANKLFRPLSEIINTIEAIENNSIYARSFPYKRQGISQAIYLKYHIENYLNELYLLKNRLISYLKLIDKSYKRSKRYKQVAESIFPLYSLVTDSLEGYIRVRGTHVHQYRYSDKDFDRLSTLELLSRGEKEISNIMQNLYNDAYRETRKVWVKKITTDIVGIHKLLEYYFKGLLAAISKDGELLLPENIRVV
jgi:hypothetical protein